MNPLAGLVRRLNQARPLVVMAHACRLALPTAEERAGRLAIPPVPVTGTGEQPTATNRAVISDAFAGDTFRYGTIAVDPLVIRTVMVRTPAALEYQARQTSSGIDIDVVATGPLDHAALAASLRQSLRAAGLPGPQVRLRQVPDIARHPETGKARRFIPL